jgi:hypothetical protein
MQPHNGLPRQERVLNGLGSIWSLREGSRRYEPCPVTSHSGKRQKACHRIAPLYGWFTEGFGTPDL